MINFFRNTLPYLIHGYICLYNSYCDQNANVQAARDNLFSSPKNQTPYYSTSYKKCSFEKKLRNGFDINVYIFQIISKKLQQENMQMRPSLDYHSYQIFPHVTRLLTRSLQKKILSWKFFMLNSISIVKIKSFIESEILRLKFL